MQSYRNGNAVVDVGRRRTSLLTRHMHSVGYHDIVNVNGMRTLPAWARAVGLAQEPCE